ncbi:GNAT family N-acetyltransferase [Planotetraspora sp. A-T 1434]|uniref:GNAT family N-acetyltransferase n=1 Tax=Planotetraspora sp. A-T 1434 TaxID=2979219 RepID=UPI0021C1D7B0|nr:GNAT family N-acetyltransferase [Planotetraspora sp. A-T 1434]MCT9929611.1 GNAT family N-acetyltransferase [Planotetraspora sp. A-T 1434]
MFTSPPTSDDEGLPEGMADAARHAEAAAAAAGVRIQEVGDPRRLRAVAGMFAEVWESPPGQDPLAGDVLRAIAHSGGAVHVAYGASGLAGATAAVFGPPGSRGVYSLIAAAPYADRGVGFALKLAQRAWALRHGATSIAWTFDPLVRRNARFNLVKLGAVAREYLPDFYGPLDDGVNTGDETDRFTAQWSLTGARTAEAARARQVTVEGPDLAVVTVDPAPGPDGRPFLARGAGSVWCRIPEDIVAVRRADPALAALWRTAVREAIAPALADGLAATAMSRDGWYHLTREETQ